MRTSPFQLERGGLDDARRIAEVHVRARRGAYRDLVPAAVLAADTRDRRESQWRERLANRDGRCWLLRDDGGLFGFAFTAPPRDPDLESGCAELYALYLLQDRVGQGFGRRLMTRTLDDLRRRGFTEVVLWCAEENRRAVQFYEAAGFAPDARVDPAPLGDTGLTRRRFRSSLRG